MRNTLSIGGDFWPILALDHGLTVGVENSVSIEKASQLIDACRGYISSVVMTYGMARLLKVTEIPVTIQCFGAPQGYPKVRVCQVEHAIAVNAQAVSVQIDFNLPPYFLMWQMQSISELVARAHKENLSVLFMISHNANIDFTRLSNDLRFCLELGADLIKVKCPVFNQDITNHREKLKDILKSSPPALIAGGEAHGNILEEVAAAKSIGFSGYCIGRNIFQSKLPSEMACKLYRIWYPDSEITHT